MNGPRRRLLAAAGSVAASLAGCLGAFPEDPSADPPSTDAPEPTDRRTRTTTEASTRSTTDASDYPATVNATATVERDEVEYVPENDTVRYVAAYRSTDSGDDSPPEREPVYETVPFDEWAETECASVAADRVNEVMADRLDGETDGVSAGVTKADGEMAVLVVHQTMSDREGDLVSEPTVSYERVKRVAPERVGVTVEFSGQTRSCVVSVTTREMDLQQE
ncbi:hypothetical protein [Halorussus halobius]|uniref:hypothetical protein n=1 Tax=Halorussus halobius TaxID=1710537 RepID=UPI0010922D40|nr:hypothetical protein [Halorussus halobius]